MERESTRTEGVSRRALLGTVGGGTIGSLAGCLARGSSSDLDGEILIDGSNTVLPHGAVVSEEFQWQNNGVIIPVQGSGTGAGFQRFSRGETDVQNASREMEADEAEMAADHGVEYVALETALDGLAVFVHPENYWCESLTVEELGAIWESDSEIDIWSDLDDNWPDEEIELYGRDPASGTFDYFTREITGEGERIGDIRSDYSASADTNVIVRGVRGSKYTLGFGGFGFYRENEGDIDVIEVDDGDGPVEPSRETIENGEYSPLTRPLYTYFNRAALERPEVAAFARFYFEPIEGKATDSDEVEDGETLTWTQWAARRVGYNATDDESADENAATLEVAIEEATA